MSPNWTDEQNALLRKLLVDDGMTAAQAAPILGRPVGAVNLHARLVGIVRLVRREWDKAALVQLRGLFDEGLTSAQIAEIMERPADSVRWRLRELGLKRGRGVRSPEQLEIEREQREIEVREADSAQASARERQRQEELAERREKLREATASRTAEIEEAKRKREAAEAAKRIERKEAKRLRRIKAAEERRKREADQAEAKRLREEEKVELESRTAFAASAGRNGGKDGNVVRFNAPMRPKKLATRETALSAQASTADLVAQFLANRGATVIREDPVEAAVNGLRGKNYTVVPTRDGWIVDGRHRLETFAELRDFAEKRAVKVPPFLLAAE